MRPKNEMLLAGVRFARMILLLCVAVAGGSAWGQAAPEVKEPPEVPTLEANFNGTSLDDVMKEYSVMTGLTPLIHPALATAGKKITWQSRTKLTKKQYLEGMVIMLTYNGIALVPYGQKFVKVVSIEAARGSAMETMIIPPETPMADSDSVISRVLSFKHMEIAEAGKIIDALKSPNGKVQPLERINGVLLTDSTANVNRILEMLDHIDQPIETKEELFIRTVRFMKASDIKTKLDDLIKDLTEKTLSPAPTAKPAVSGPPIMIPGIIRARPTPPPVQGDTSVTTAEGEVEKGMIRGKVKIVADDRTGILIIITLRSNKKFLDDVVDALDKDVKFIPDVLVKVYRMEFADANEVATMLNSLIGAATKKDATASAAAPGTANTPRGTTPGTGGAFTLQEYVAERAAATKEKETEKETVVSPTRKSKVGELAAENVKILPDKRTNALIVMASKSDHAAIGELIKEMDMMLSQVLIEAVIINIQLSDALQTGVQWLQNAMAVYDKKGGNRTPIGAFAGSFGGGSASGSGGGGSLPTPVDAAGITSLPGAPGLSYYFTHYGLNINAVVQMASSDSRTKVVSTPVILTTDNTEATLKVTDQIYVYNGQTLTQVGIAVQPIQNFTIKDVGLELKVKPHINTNRVVMMEISQSVSDPGDVGDPKAGSLVSRTRSLNASIAVRDRETIILGGQVRQNDDNNRSKVPILGDIPLLGRLFNTTTQSGGRSEMIVLVTPYVLDTPAGIAAESMRRKRALDLEGLWKRGDGQWTDSKLAEPTRQQAKLEIKEAKDRERAEKAEVARLAAEARKEAKDRELAEKAEVARLAAETRKSEAEAAKAAKNKAKAAPTEQARPQVNPALLELMLRREAELSGQFKEVDKATAPVETGQ